MNKLKIKNQNNNHNILKNSFLINKKYMKNIIFENIILYKNNYCNIFEFNNIKNLNIPLRIKTKKIYTIENNLLFNYNFNYKILYTFNKIIGYNNYYIKGRIILSYKRYNKKKNDFFFFFFGIIFYIKKKNLYNYNFIIKIKNNNLKKKYINNYNKFQLKHLNLKIKKIKNFFIFSRISYIKELKKKSKFLKKNKKNNASI